MKIIALSWHPGNSNILTAGGYTRFYEIAKRCSHELIIIDKSPSLYTSLKNKNIRIIDYSGGKHFTFFKSLSPILFKLIDRGLSIMQILFLLIKLDTKNAVIYVPYSELIELTIPAILIKFTKGIKVVFCNLNVNTYFIDRPINVFLHRFADRTITLSKDLQKNLLESGIKASYVNGVGFDIEKLPRENIKKQFDAIYIGRHIPQKGIWDLIEIWNVLINRLHKKLYLITIGDIPDYIKEEIQNKIQEYNLEKFITLKSKVSDEMKKKLLLKCKIMVFPSRQEGWGIAPMEALSYRVPVTAYNLPIYQESIGKTNALRIVNLGDCNSFAKTIIDTLSKNNYYSNEAAKWKPVLKWDDVAKREWEIITK